MQEPPGCSSQADLCEFLMTEVLHLQNEPCTAAEPVGKLFCPQSSPARSVTGEGQRVPCTAQVLANSCDEHRPSRSPAQRGLPCTLGSADMPVDTSCPDTVSEEAEQDSSAEVRPTTGRRGPRKPISDAAAYTRAEGVRIASRLLPDMSSSPVLKLSTYPSPAFSSLLSASVEIAGAHS